MDARRTLTIAAALIAIATAMGAFGAHALKAHLSQDKLQVYETAVRYQFLHALGLVAIGLWQRSNDAGLLRWSATIILAGIVLFSGSLYLLTFNAPRVLGILTPLGGLGLIAGWILVAVCASRS